MPNIQLLEWVNAQKRRGFNDQQLHGALIKNGYTHAQIDEVLGYKARPEPSHSPKKKINASAIIIVGIVAVGLLMGGIIFFIFPEIIGIQPNVPGPEIIHSSVNASVDLNDDQGNKIGEMKTGIEADIEITTDCGDFACFKEKFKECEPSSLTSKLMENLIYHYEIIGIKDGLCEVKSKFIANPNPLWVNKEMICAYDNTIDFETAVTDMDNCHGELSELMNPAAPGSPSQTVTPSEAVIDTNQNITLILEFPKDIYKVGEPAQGLLRSKGPQITIKIESGSYTEYTSTIVGEFSFNNHSPWVQRSSNNFNHVSSSFGNSNKTSGFDEYEIGSFYSPGLMSNSGNGWFTPLFHLEGEYNYTFYVYDCDDILEKSGNPCILLGQAATAHQNRDTNGIKPLMVISKIITVKGKIDSFSGACKSDDDCELCQTCGGLVGKENSCVDRDPKYSLMPAGC